MLCIVYYICIINYTHTHNPGPKKLEQGSSRLAQHSTVRSSAACLTPIFVGLADGCSGLHVIACRYLGPYSFGMYCIIYLQEGTLKNNCRKQIRPLHACSFEGKQKSCCRYLGLLCIFLHLAPPRSALKLCKPQNRFCKPS